MARNRKTSPKAGKAASKVLRDGRTSKASKTAAASALSQRAPVRAIGPGEARLARNRDGHGHAARRATLGDGAHVAPRVARSADGSAKLHGGVGPG